MVTAAFIGIFSSEFKIKLSINSKYSVLFISVLFLVRLTAYSAFIDNTEFRLFDPRESYEINNVIGFDRYSENWVAPLDKDQCWSNIECTASREEIKLVKKGVFKIAYKDR